MLIMRFPFSMTPDSVVGGGKYTLKTYADVFYQLSKGVDVYMDNKIIGKSNGFDGKDIIIKVDDLEFIESLKETPIESLCTGTYIDADVENGLAIAARVEGLCILRKTEVGNLVSKADVVLKEKTLDLDYNQAQEEIVPCLMGCNGDKDLCIPLILERLYAGKRVFVLYGAHIKEKLDEIEDFKYEYVFQNDVKVGMYIERNMEKNPMALMTLEEKKAQFPEIKLNYEPMVDCRICKGKGIKGNNNWCMCLFVRHDSCKEIGGEDVNKV